MQKINKSKRVMVPIPEGEDAHNFLYIENKNSRLTKYELLNELVRNRPKSKEDRAISAFNEFTEKISELFPEKKSKLELLRPLILKKIINGEHLDDWYYEELKKL
jgi:hypothetical protein